MSAASNAQSFALVIHGGVGVLAPDEMPPELKAAYRQGLTDALKAGYEVLRDGATALDAVEAAVRIMEDDPAFNAGRGSSFNIDGQIEMDASIMNGRDLDAGCVALVRRTRNPISLARVVMERTPHVLVAGEGADRLARDHGLQTAPPHYFWTQRRWDVLQERLRRRTPYGQRHDNATEEQLSDRRLAGTVGAVAVDTAGNLAAATSTGGRVGKLPGRVGDSAVIGAGTYANNATAAISSTGLGEYQLRALGTRTVSDLMEYRHLPPDVAVKEVHQRLVSMGATIGMIAVDPGGRISMHYSGHGMNRGYVREDGEMVVRIHQE